ncbi:MAG: type II toxin-antitoxin system PemK/MazF family toxin [Candidatus Aenigmarchaeota archaeon]|nr:type II toxin-antitoxin system PemK/MazF family toxin [Candidatus Aenigmarchaeota archaeon]
MEGFVKGDVVVLPFPFSDLSASKRRPAAVVAKGEYGDVILCQITSKAKKGAETIELRYKDFREGKLKITSYVRPRKIFTADLGLILYRAGKIKKEKITEVENSICRVIKE